MNVSLLDTRYARGARKS